MIFKLSSYDLNKTNGIIIMQQCYNVQITILRRQRLNFTEYNYTLYTGKLDKINEHE